VCRRLAGSAARLAEITGLRLDPYFAVPEMTWVREALGAGGVVTTTDTWLLARLGAEYVTAAATASRTLLLDLDRTEWPEEACAAFGLDPAGLPRIAVEVCHAPDATALGVAALARLGTGEAAGVDEAAGPARVQSVAEPAIGPEQAAERLAAFEAGLRAVLAVSG
jgi:glycerol kinase